MQKPIVLLAEAWGANEAKIRRPFVGASGVELLRQLDDAKIIELTNADHDYISRFYRTGDPTHLDCAWGLHPEVFRTNVFNLHPPGNDLAELCGPKQLGLQGYPPLLKSKYVLASLAPELERLGDELMSVDPNLIVCLGNTAMWALTGKVTIGKIRGTTHLTSLTVSGYKCLPTYHPAAIMRQWELRPTVIIDLMKAKREAEFPEVRRPQREIWIEPTIEDIRTFHENHIRGCQILSVDIETAGRQVTCIGFAPQPDLGIVVPFLDTRKTGRNYWNTRQDEQVVWKITKEILEGPEAKLFQNGLYDIAFLWRSYKIRVRNAQHDTMLLHHALQPESLKGLGFLGSLYCDEGPWKTERGAIETIKRDE